MDSWLIPLRALAEASGKEVVVIAPFSRRKDCGGIHFLNNASVYDFLALFKDADGTFVDSFHGLCFSLIFRKDFLVLGDKYFKGDDRKINLLSKFGLLSRMIENEQEILSKPLKTDYSGSVEDAIFQRTQKSIEIVKGNLGKAFSQSPATKHQS